jgi:hypothetical protein
MDGIYSKCQRSLDGLAYQISNLLDNSPSFISSNLYCMARSAIRQMPFQLQATLSCHGRSYKWKFPIQGCRSGASLGRYAEIDLDGMFQAPEEPLFMNELLPKTWYVY